MPSAASVPSHRGRADRPEVRVRLPTTVKACLSGLPSDEDGPLAAGPKLVEVVRSRELLDDEPGVRRENAELVGGDQPERVATDPADRRFPGMPLLVDRREV